MTAPVFDRVKPAARLFVEGALTEGAALPLERERNHYLAHVLRLQPGASVLLFNGIDGLFQATLEAAGRRGLALRVGPRLAPMAPEPPLRLCFAPIKRQRLDLLVEKATELGATRLTPVLTRHTVAERVNLDRLRAIVIEAAEQCERLALPQIDEPVTLRALLGTWEAGLPLYACLEAGAAIPLAAALQAGMPAPVALLIGPEGGFAEEERGWLAAAGCVRPVGLGPRLLRAETAALAALAIASTLQSDAALRPAGRAPAS